jgi:hypothetical protein
MDAGRARRRDNAGEPVDGVGVRTRAADTELVRVSRYRDVGSGARSQRPRQRRPATTSIGGGGQSQAGHQPTDDAKTHPRTPAPAKADPIAIADAAHHPMVPAAGGSSKDASCRLPERLAPPSNSDGWRGVFVVASNSASARPTHAPTDLNVPIRAYRTRSHNVHQRVTLTRGSATPRVSLMPLVGEQIDRSGAIALARAAAPPVCP